MTEPKNIYEAMNAIMKEVGYVQKTGNFSGGGANYKYAGEADLINALRPHLIANGVVIYPSRMVPEIETNETVKTFKDNVEKKLVNRVVVTVRYHFHHGPSDTGFDVEVIGEGQDGGDKASYKAMTGAFKYALRQPFVIETGDEPEKEAVEVVLPSSLPTQEEMDALLNALADKLAAEEEKPDANARLDAKGVEVITKTLRPIFKDAEHMEAFCEVAVGVDKAVNMSKKHARVLAWFAKQPIARGAAAVFAQEVGGD